MTPRLSFVMPFYLNQGMLALQYGIWAAYPEDLKSQIEVVLVDDGSPEGAAIDVPRPEGLPALRMYRVTVDIPWNQHGARNLGAREAAGEWLFLTDMDHVLPAESLARVLQLKSAGSIYTFRRLDAPNLTPTIRADGSEKPHPNTFAMTRAKFWEIGGYDEAYRGVYGTDGLFRERAFALAKHRHLDDVPVIRYSREVVPDASTRTLPRKEGRAPGVKKQVWLEKTMRGEADVIETVTFPWVRQL